MAVLAGCECNEQNTTSRDRSPAELYLNNFAPSSCSPASHPIPGNRNSGSGKDFMVSIKLFTSRVVFKTVAQNLPFPMRRCPCRKIAERKRRHRADPSYSHRGNETKKSESPRIIEFSIKARRNPPDKP